MGSASWHVPRRASLWPHADKRSHHWSQHNCRSCLLGWHHGSCAGGCRSMMLLHSVISDVGRALVLFRSLDQKKKKPTQKPSFPSLPSTMEFPGLFLLACQDLCRDFLGVNAWSETECSDLPRPEKTCSWYVTGRVLSSTFSFVPLTVPSPCLIVEMAAHTATASTEQMSVGHGLFVCTVPTLTSLVSWQNLALWIPFYCAMGFDSIYFPWTLLTLCRALFALLCLF